MLSEVEFYNTPEGDVMVKRAGKPVVQLVQNDRALIQEVLAMVRDLYPEAFKRLSELYTRYERNRIYYEFMMVSRFIRCNFGEYDQNRYDVDANGSLKFEEVRCPLRGECREECVVCKPKLDTKLTERETEVFECIGRGLQASDIADELCISIATVNRHRENLKAKLGLRSVGQLVRYYYEQVKK